MIKTIQSLVKQLNQYRNEYYNDNNPTVSDYEYDNLFDELKQLEEQTGFIMSNSPTQSVGFEVKSKLEKTTHSIPLLSLDKTKQTDDVIRFIGNKPCILMLKYDGLTIELEYNNGELIKGSTRGDGYVGEDITHNIKTFKNVPLKINYTGYLKVVGEAIIHKNDFETINNNLSIGVEKYKTPRNLVAGSVRQLDSKLCSERQVYFMPWDVLEGLDGDSRFDKLQRLTMLGFPTNSDLFYIENGTTTDRLDEMIDYLKEKADRKNIPIDGLVVKYDNIEYSKSLGGVAHHNRDGLAFKFTDETADTTLLNVEWSMGRTGTLTPVAVFKTVELDGTDISRASLHNISIIENLKLGIGDNISVQKCNLIIPQIVENYTQSNSLEIPNSCPICNGKTEIEQLNDSKELICINPNCKGKLLGRFVHFVSKNAMNIDGLSEASLEKFIDNGWLKTFSDIYDLKKYKNEIINMDGFGEKSYNKLIQAIEDSKNVKLENFIVALGIDNIGKTASKTISKFFKGNWFSFENAILGGFDFTILDDFGQKMNDSIYNWYKFIKEPNIWAGLSYKMNFTELKIINEDTTVINNKFQGKTIVITGSFKNYTRDTMQAKLESMGAKVSSSVSKKTDYVMVGTDAGSKLTKARELGIETLSENDI